VTERHCVVLLAYDQVPEQHDLTVQALESILAQDVGPMDVLLIDNGSINRDTPHHFRMVTDLYLDRESDTRVHPILKKQNEPPTKVMNCAYQYCFKTLGHSKVLAVPNDVRLPPNFYRLINQWQRGLITASEIRDPLDISLTGAFCEWDVRAISENTPMSATLVRRWFYDAIVSTYGSYFDEQFRNYCSDCDLALRMAACGLRGIQTSIPYFHYGSASWRLLPEEDGKKNY
jgi:hypothetical protein